MKELYKYNFSVLNPILWLCGISTPLCLVGAYAFRDVHSVSKALIITAIVPIAIACIIYVLFTILLFFFPKSFFQKPPSQENLLDNNDAVNKSHNLAVNTNSQRSDKTLIEKSLNDAIDKLRDFNRIDLNELNLKYARPWQIGSISATVIITAFGLFSYFIAPEWIKNRVENFIRENIIGKQAIDIVKNETNKYAEDYEYKWLFFWQAASLVKHGNINDAVNSLKKALGIDPKLKNDFKAYANKIEEFKTLREHIEAK